MSRMVSEYETTFPRGTWLYTATIATGPIVMSVKTKDVGAVFQTMDDGTFTVSTHGKVDLSDELIYKATIPSGDFLDISLSSTGT